MVQNNTNTDGIQRYRKKRQLAKAKRLAANRPLWKDEKYMKKEEYENYIDSFLHLEDDATPNIDQAKIAVQMYEKKCKYENQTKSTVEVEDNTIAIILQKAEQADQD